MIWSYGHMHTGGIETTMFVNGKEYCKSIPHVLTVTTLYDVDPKSQRNAPLPGGKHGGIMALFFGAMHCDPGTYDERYVCRQSTCVPVKKKLPFMRTYKDYASCQQACGADTPIEAEESSVAA